MYGTKEQKRDSARAMKEYRQRAFYKKYFVLGRLRQKGDERPIQFISMLFAIGIILPATQYA